MKKILLLLSAFFLIHSTSFAQAPQGINYQGVARNAQGAAIGMTNITVTVTIVSGSTTHYQERHAVQTDTFGLYSLVIGNPTTIIQGVFTNIPWSAGNLTAKIDIDPGSGTQTVGTFPLMSVPYSLYSNNSFNTSSIQGQPVSGAVPQPGDVLQYNAGIWSPAAPSNGSVTSVSASTPLNVSGTTTPTISIPAANGSGTDGYLSSTDWTTFNNKGNGTVTSVTGTPPLSVLNSSTTPVITMPAADGSTNGFLTQTDWNTFNNKGNGTLTSITTGTGLLPAGTFTNTATISADYTTAIWNADKLQTTPINAVPPSSGQVLQFNGTQWAPANANAGTVTNITLGTGLLPSGASITTTGTVSADNASPLWNANQLQGIPVNPGAAVNNILQYNGTAWVPTTLPSSSLPTPTVGSLLYTDGSNTWNGTNPAQISSDGNSITVVNTTTVGTAGTFISNNAGVSSQPALKAESFSSTSYAIWADNQSGAAILATSAGPYALTADLSAGGGNALVGRLVNSASGNAIMGINDNTSIGVTGYFENQNPGNGSPVFKVLNQGAGFSGQFSGGAGLETDKIRITNGAALNAVLTSDATGNASWQAAAGGLPAGTNGQMLFNNSGVWTPSNINNLFFDGANMGIGINTPNAPLDMVSTNTLTTLEVTNNGTGSAGKFFINNAASTADALSVTTNGAANSKAIYGKHTGNGVVYGVLGEATGSGGGAGVYGYASNAGGTNNYGVAGFNQSPSSGYGVFGQGFYGVYGQNNSSGGYGVYGIANTSGSTAVAGFSNTNAGKAGHFEITSAVNTSDALYAITNGTGKAVAGIQTNTTTAVTYGVYGKNAGANGYGVYGDNTSTTGSAYGVYGTTFSTAGRAVYGIATNATGQSIGVFGQTNSNTNGAFGIFGAAPAATGNITGVYGETASNTGTGTWGYASNTTGVNYGVVGESESTTGTGVWGHAKATSGLNYGGFFVTESATGYALYTQNNGGGITARLNGSVMITDGTQGANKVFTSDAVGVGSWQTPSAAVFGGWDLLGNLGTSPVNNFVGTKDAVDLVFRTGNAERLRINNTTSQLLINNPGTPTQPIISWLPDNNTGIFTPGPDALAFSTNGTERMRIDPIGNVGIGTTLPTNGKLDVQSGGGTAAVSAIHNGTSNAGYFQVNNASNSATALFATHNGSGNTFLSTNTGTGHAGFFQVSNASNTLNAVNATTNGPGAAINATNTHSGANALRDGLRVTATGAGGAGTINTAGYFSASGATSNYAAIFDQGSVGIGTLNPTSILHITGTADPLQVTVENGGGAFKTGIKIKTAAQEWFIGKESGASQGLRFSDITGGQSRMVIETSGNVGIAAMAPVSTLKVNGSIAGNFVNPTAANYVCTPKDYFVLITINSPVMLPLANSVDPGSVIIIRNTTGAAISVNAQGADNVFPLNCCMGGTPSASISGMPSPTASGRYISDGIGKWFEW